VRVLVAHSFYRIPGGEDRYVSQQLDLLRGRHEVDVLAGRNETLTSTFGTATRMLLSRAVISAVEARIKQFRPDVIHVHNIYPALGPSVHLVARRLKIPLIMTVHNLRLRCPNGLMFTQGQACRRCEGGNYANAVLHRCFPSSAQSSAYALALWSHRFLLRLEDKVGMFITPSNFMRGQLNEWGIPASRVETIRTSVPVTSQLVSATGNFGVYVGRLSTEKGLPILLRALSAAGDPPFRIVGDGPLLPELIHLAAQLQLSRIEFVGRLSPSKVQETLLQARFLTMPSRCYENAPLAVLEAMAAGRPVIVTEKGGLPELVERGGGIVCESGDALGLARAMCLLMDDDQECTRLGAQALRVAREEFSPKRHLERLESIYRTMCSVSGLVGGKKDRQPAP
jgi:glycosyltransferase involved in cell wall biosynthesis